MMVEVGRERGCHRVVAMSVHTSVAKAQTEPRADFELAE